jgi:hypothetical protein
VASPCRRAGGRTMDGSVRAGWEWAADTRVFLRQRKGSPCRPAAAAYSKLGGGGCPAGGSGEEAAALLPRRGGGSFGELRWAEAAGRGGGRT